MWWGLNVGVCSASLFLLITFIDFIVIVVITIIINSISSMSHNNGVADLSSIKQ